jgi:hypothetical protein
MEIVLTFPESMDKAEKAFVNDVAPNDPKEAPTETNTGRTTGSKADEPSTLLTTEDNTFNYDEDSRTAVITWRTATTPRQTLEGLIAEESEYVKGELAKGRSPGEIWEDYAEFFGERAEDAREVLE